MQELILDMMKERVPSGEQRLLSFSAELLLTGYTCRGSLFCRNVTQGAKGCADEVGVKKVLHWAPFFYRSGLPLKSRKLYNVAAVFSHGEVLGLVPKKLTAELQ